MQVTIVQNFIDIIRGKKDLFLPELFRCKMLKYHVISLGQFCFPRVFCTLAKIKPAKKYGELSCPFDLSFHYDIKQICKLIESNFADYFNGLYYLPEENIYKNDRIQACYNHDGNLTREEFIKKYKKRIKNFNYYLNSSKYIYFVLSVFNCQVEDILEFERILKEKRSQETFHLIILNHGNNILNINSKNISCINNLDISKINKDELWIDRLRHHKKHKAADLLYNRTLSEMKQIMVKHLH